MKIRIKVLFFVMFDSIRFHWMEKSSGNFLCLKRQADIFCFWVNHSFKPQCSSFFISFSFKCTFLLFK